MPEPFRIVPAKVVVAPLPPAVSVAAPAVPLVTTDVVAALASEPTALPVPFRSSVPVPFRV